MAKKSYKNEKKVHFFITFFDSTPVEKVTKILEKLQKFQKSYKFFCEFWRFLFGFSFLANSYY